MFPETTSDAQRLLLRFGDGRRLGISSIERGMPRHVRGAADARRISGGKGFQADLYRGTGPRRLASHPDLFRED